MIAAGLKSRARPAGQWGACLFAFLMLTAGCATGTDAVAPGGGNAVVSPGGQSHIFYDQPRRKNVKDFSGSSVQDENSRISLADYPGKVIVLNVWASWCAPCRAETYEFKKLVDGTGGQPVQLIGVDVGDNRSAAADFVHNFEVTYPSIFDPDRRIGLAFPGIPFATVPITLVIDRQARVAAVFIGQVLESDLLPTILRVLAES